MASSDFYLNKVSAVDKAVEWGVKGMNMGFYIGAFFAKYEVQRKEMGKARYAGALSALVIRNMVVMGGSFATYMFLATALEKSRKVDDGLNYGIGAGITLALWHKEFKIPRHHLARYVLAFATLAGYMGNMMKPEH